MEESQTTANQVASGLVPSDLLPPKEEPQVQPEQMKSEASTPKLEPLMTDVKEEVDEVDYARQTHDTLQEEVPDVADDQPLDSEDSLSQEHVASELRRLDELRVSATLAELRVRAAGDSNQDSEGGAVAPATEETTASTTTQSRQGAVAPDSGWNWEDNESYAPQRSGRFRGRLQSPDPYMLGSTIWVRHDHEASARIRENPMDQLHNRMRAVEHNLDTLRTRLTQVADLRDAQGIREDHRAIIERLNEVEECATVHTLR